MSTKTNNHLRVEGSTIQLINKISLLRPKYLRQRSGDFTGTTLANKLSSLQDGELLLLPFGRSELDLDEQADLEAYQAHLTEVPELGVGRENNRGDIHFGQLYLHNSDGLDKTELVAVKYVHPLTATREISAASEVDRRFGNRRSFRAIGTVKRDDRIGLLTKYDHTINTLDNILWSDGYETGGSKRIKAMGQAATWMIELHARKLVHGDAQSKNIAFGNNGISHYPDLETMKDIGDKFVGDYGVEHRLADVSDLFVQGRNSLPVTRVEKEVFVRRYILGQLMLGMRNPLRAEDLNNTIFDTADIVD